MQDVQIFLTFAVSMTLRHKAQVRSSVDTDETVEFVWNLDEVV